MQKQTRVLALCHGTAHGHPDGRGTSGVTVTTVDVDASVRPHHVADVTRPGALSHLEHGFDVVECVYGFPSSDDYALWDNMVSALRKDGNGYVVTRLSAGSLNKMHRRYTMHSLNKASSFRAYTPIDVTNDQAHPCSTTDKERAAAAIEFVTRVAGRRYAKGKAMIVQVPIAVSLPLPSHVRRYVGDDLSELSVFRVVSLSEKAKRTRKKREALDSHVKQESDRFVDVLVNCITRDMCASGSGDAEHSSDRFMSHLESPHYPLESCDVDRLFYAAIRTCCYDTCRFLFDIYSGLVSETVGDLLSEVAIHMNSDEDTDEQRRQDLQRVHDYLWDTYLPDEDKDEMRTYLERY